MNREVEVTGLTMKTKVGSNLLISEDNVEGNYSADRMVSGRKALLEPVSSISGKTGEFYYTLDAKASGEKAHDETAEGKGYVPYSEAKVAPEGEADTDIRLPGVAEAKLPGTRKSMVKLLKMENVVE